MSEKILRIFLDELDTVRIVCQHANCGGIIEYPLERLRAKFQNVNECPLCKEDFGGRGSPLYALAEAIENLKFVSKRVKVEFVLDDPTPIGK